MQAKISEYVTLIIIFLGIILIVTLNLEFSLGISELTHHAYHPYTDFLEGMPYRPRFWHILYLYLYICWISLTSLDSTLNFLLVFSDSDTMQAPIFQKEYHAGPDFGIC